jgi:hypothetical protein
MATAPAPATGARRKSAIPFSNYALVDRNPVFAGDIKDPTQAVQLDDHLFPYEGCAIDKKSFIWGVYGSMSQSHALFMAEAEATRRKVKLLLVQAFYQLDNFEIVRTQVDHAMMKQTGYMHVDRLKTQFREEVKDFVLEAAQSLLKGFNVDAHAKKSLNELLLEFPALVPAIFEMDRKLNMVVHQVRPSWNPNERRGIYVCTMRRIVKRIHDAEVRFLSNVKVHV